MEYYYCDTEPSVELTRALTEIRIIQRKRQKRKMIETVTIGDGEVTMFYGNVSKIYKGTVMVLRMQDVFNIEVRSCDNRVLIPCEQIRCCSVQKETVILQFPMDYVWEKCTFKFYDKTQADVFTSTLPPITKPQTTECNSTDSSDTDFDDSGNEKTTAFKNNSFNSNPPDELEEL